MNDTLKAASTLAIGLHIMRPAMAHNGEIHGQSKKTTPSETNEPEASGTDISEADIQPPSMDSTVEVSPTVSAAATPVSPFSAGLGEILFSVVLMFPWLLITLKKQLHSKSRL